MEGSEFGFGELKGAEQTSLISDMEGASLSERRGVRRWRARRGYLTRRREIEKYFVFIEFPSIITCSTLGVRGDVLAQTYSKTRSQMGRSSKHTCNLKGQSAFVSRADNVCVERAISVN